MMGGFLWMVAPSWCFWEWGVGGPSWFYFDMRRYFDFFGILGFTGQFSGIHGKLIAKLLETTREFTVDQLNQK
jgi:hypothetical protein